MRPMSLRPGPVKPIAAPLERRVAAAQVEALFNVVAFGVTAGAATGILLIASLYRLGLVDLTVGLFWSLALVACALAHLLLRFFYFRAARVDANWRVWAGPFTFIAFLEGVVWGYAIVGLVPGERFDAESIVLLAGIAITAGAIPAFAAYLPAFLALFLPATLFFVAASLNSVNPVLSGSIGLILLYAFGMGLLGVFANRAYANLLRLRFRSEQLAEDLQRQKEIAEEASRAKSKFLAAASHDLRQPVHALGLLAGAMRRVELPPDGVRLLDQIELSTQAMDGLFSALLDISRLDAGVVDVQRRAFAVGPMMRRVARDYAGEADEKGLTLTCVPCGAAVETDPVLAERILRNLVANAVRYTERGGVLVGARRRGGRLSLQVWDSGPGIAPGEREAVFQEYYQLSNPERDRSKGLGLGLAIVRRLADLLGAPVTLRSNVGKGSCFALELPLAALAEPEAEPAAPPVSGSFGLGLIVVIEDEIAVRAAMASLLEGWGHTVIAAGSGDSAIAQLAHSPVRPSLIVCDYRLREGENGIEVIERLRGEFNAAIPAMLVTGDTAPDRLTEARASGLPLLHKPVSSARLRASVAQLLAEGE